MRRLLNLTNASAVLIVAAVALWGCSTPPQPAAPTEALSVAPPAQSKMFDSDPNGDWNIFPDPTTGDVSVYHKGEYLGTVSGNEPEDPPIPRKKQGEPNPEPPAGY